MDYRQKVEEAQAVIKAALTGRVAPVVACSFGKDSLALVHMVRQLAPHVELVHMRGAFLNVFSAKYKFAMETIQTIGLNVHVCLPSRYDYIQYEDLFLMRQACSFGGSYFCNMVIEPSDRYVPGKPFACARRAYWEAPRVDNYYTPWDVQFFGQKRADGEEKSDGRKGAQVFPVPFGYWGKMIDQRGTILQVTPLWNWTDADVWRYTHEHGIPYDAVRYAGDPHGTAREGAAGEVNPEFCPTCWCCLDYRNAGREITCSQSGSVVPFIGFGKEQNMEALASLGFRFDLADEYIRKRDQRGRHEQEQT